MRRKFATTVIACIILMSCVDRQSSNRYSTFLSATSDSTTQLYFEPVIPSDEHLYIAHVGKHYWEYGSALDVEGDTMLIEHNVLYKYLGNNDRARVIDFSDSSLLYLVNLDSSNVDSLFHYKIKTSREFVDSPAGSEYVVLVCNWQRGVVGVYLLLLPNGSTNNTNKDFIVVPRGTIGFMDTSKVEIFLPDEIHYNIL